jgi:zinc protease
MADGLAASILNHRVFVTPETSLELVRAGLAAATPAACLEGFREAWVAGQPRIFVSGTLPGGIGAVQVAAAARESLRKRVDPARETAADEFAYTDFGPPGTIAQRTHIADLDIHCVEFANGVKLNLKATDFAPDSIRFAARFGSGWTGEPADKRGLRMLMGHGFTALGLGRHKREALNHLSAGVIASFAVGMNENAFTADGSTDGAGAARWLRLLTASLSDPGWHKEELPEIRQRIIFTFEQRDQNTTQALADYLYGKLTGHDPRYARPDFKRVLGYSVADLRAWVEPQLQSGPLEIGIVGDFEPEEMIELAARTVGCLPRRGGPAPVRPVKFDPLPKPKPLTVNATTRSGAVQVAWALPAIHGHADLRRESVLAETLENRLVARIREEMGATYAPAAGVWRSGLQRANGYLIVSLTCEPGDTQRVAEAVRQVADDLARGRVSEEELDRARQPQIQAIPAQMKNNGFWLHGAVLQAQSRPEVLDLPRTRLSDLTQMTADDITALAARVLPAANAALFTAVPAPPKKK